MKSINEIRLLGNLTDDPEVRETEYGMNVVTFTVATNRTWKDKDGEIKERAQFTRCVAFRGLADILSKYGKKGNPLHVSGYLQTRSYDAADGSKRYATEVIAEDVVLLNRAPSGGNSEWFKEDDIPPEFKQDGNAKSEEINVNDIPL